MPDVMKNVGLKITFQKHNITAAKNENAEKKKEKDSVIKYTALGYYDTICFDNVSTMEEFKPSSDMSKGNDDFKNEYVLRCIAPQVADNSTFKVADDSPFVAVVSIDLMDTAIKKILNCDKNDNSSLKLYSIVKEKLTEIAKKISNVKFCLYQCLGYTDMVAVLTSDGFNSINSFLTEMRMIPHDGEYFVSSTYTVFGLNSDYKGDFSDKTISLISRWAYKNIGLGCEKQHDSYFTEQKNIKVEYGVFDKSCTLELLPKEFYEIFQKDPYGDEAIKLFNTNLLFEGLTEDKWSSGKASCKTRKPKYNVKAALDKFVSVYRNLINAENLHKRLCSAMINIEHFYELISITNHSLDVSEIVGEFYFNSLNSLTEVIRTINKIEDEVQKNAKITEFENAVEQFRSSVQFLLFDVLRSDHSFFEVPSIAHPSIGGTIKILLAYNRIINEWNKQFEPNDEKIEQHKMSFLVTSGGCDNIKYSNILWRFEDLLPHKTHNGNELKLPIIISIPEASLYDVEGTLFRLAHEFFHLRGERIRKGKDLENCKPIIGRYARFYRGLLNEYIDYCYESIIEEVNSKECANGATEINNASYEYAVALQKTKKVIEKNKIYQVADVERLYKEDDIKGKGNDGYVKLAAENLERYIFMSLNGYSKVLSDVYCLTKRLSVNGKYETQINQYNTRFKFVENIYHNISIFKDLEFRNFAKPILENNNKGTGTGTLYEQYISKCIDDLITDLEGIPNKNIYINKRLTELFKKYNYDKDEKNLITELCNELCKLSDNLFSIAPQNAFEYAIGQCYEVSPAIAEFGYLYGKHDFERFKSQSDCLAQNFGLVYMQDTTDSYNIISDNNTYDYDDLSCLPMSEYYSHLWSKATLKFFLSGYQIEEGDDRALNCKTYSSFVQGLYRECFADVSALKLLEKMIPLTNEKVENSIENKFALFEKFIGAFLSEQRNIDRLFGAGKNTINKGVLLRIGAVYTAYVGQLKKEDGEKREKLAAEINRIGGVQNSKKAVKNKIEILMDIFEKLYANKSYVQELVEYLKTCLDHFPKTSNLPECPIDSNAQAEFLLNCWANIYQEN